MALATIKAVSAVLGVTSFGFAPAASSMRADFASPCWAANINAVNPVFERA